MDNNELFSQYRRLFESQLEANKNDVVDLKVEVTVLKIQLAVLKTKMIFIGAIAGLVVSGLVSLAVKFIG